MKGNRLICLLLVLAIVAPVLVFSQRRPWRRTITVKDRREGGTPEVAKVSLSAYYMISRVSPGLPIMVGPDGKPENVMFNKLPEGFVKFSVDKIEWLDEEFDRSPEYKVVVRSLWVDMYPKLYVERKREMPNKSASVLRRLFIAAPNVEYIHGDSLPPPIIYKIDRNNNYTFSVGFKAVTPNTSLEKPFSFAFNFTVDGLLRNGKGYGEPEEPPRPVIRDTNTVVKKEEDQGKNTADIDEAVRRAIEEERVDDLIGLINDHPDVQSVREARAELDLHMTRELIDSVTYKVEIEYERFTRALPKRDDIDISFSMNGEPLARNLWPYNTWKDGKLFVTTKRDSVDYTITATHRTTPENKAEITLNSVRDFINLVYVDTLENEAVAIHITGGKGPFMLHLESQKGGDFFGMEGAMKIYGDTVLQKEKLARKFKIKEEGEFRIFVEDADQLKKTGASTVLIIPPPPIPPIVWYISLGVLGAFLIGFLIWKREQKRKDEEMEKLLEARGGKDPRVKRKPKPELLEFWRETAISDLSLHKNFVREVATYLKERQIRETPDSPMIEGIVLGTVLKFDFENEQYEVRLDRFRAIDAKPLDYYDDKPDQDKWPEIREVTEDHRDLVKIGWLQVVEDQPMRLGQAEQAFQDEQFSELFQLMVKIDILGDRKECGFFTRTISGKINNAKDRKEGVTGWMDWNRLENAGYYESNPKSIKSEEGQAVAESHIDGGL